MPAAVSREFARVNLVSLVALLAAAVGCSSGGSNGDNGQGMDSGTDDTTAPPPGDCYVLAPGSSDPQKCAAESDCGAGGRCDKALSPPLCVQLYCLPVGSACSDDVQCQTGNKCIGSKCSSCTVCGSQCVDLQTDPNNCGACDHPVPAGQKCVAGKAACTDLDPSTEPAVSMSCRTDTSSFAMTADGKPASGTYVLTSAVDWEDSSSACSAVTYRWVVRLSGDTGLKTWEMVRIGSDGTLQSLVGNDTFNAPGQVWLDVSCNQGWEHLDGTPFSDTRTGYYAQDIAGGFRLTGNPGTPTTDYTFMVGK